MLSVGLSLRPTDMLLFTGQMDRVRGSEVQDALRGNDPRLGADVTVPDRTDWRVGGELTFTLSFGGVGKVRGGIARRKPLRLAYTGADAALGRVFAERPSDLELSAGASMLGEFFNAAARLDVDVLHVDTDPELLLGLSVRF